MLSSLVPAVQSQSTLEGKTIFSAGGFGKSLDVSAQFVRVLFWWEQTY